MGTHNANVRTAQPHTSPAAALAAALAASTMNPFVGHPFVVGPAQSYASQYSAAAAALAAAAAAAAHQHPFQLSPKLQLHLDAVCGSSGPGRQASHALARSPGQQQQAPAPYSDDHVGPVKRPASPILASLIERACEGAHERARKRTRPDRPASPDGQASAGAQCDRQPSEEHEIRCGRTPTRSASSPSCESESLGGTGTGSDSESRTSARVSSPSPSQPLAQTNGIDEANGGAAGGAKAGGQRSQANELAAHASRQRGSPTCGTKSEPRLEICREFLRNNCKRGELECRFAHPRAHQLRLTAVAGHDAWPQANEQQAQCQLQQQHCEHRSEQRMQAQYVTVCKDFLRGKCSRASSKCRYLHPASHLLKCQLDPEWSVSNARGRRSAAAKL